MENLVAALIRHIYFFGVNAVEMHYVALCTLAYGNYAVGVDASLACLEIIDFAVDEVVVLRKAQENQVVHGDHRRNVAAPYVERKLTAKAVENVHTVVVRIAHHAVHRAPVRAYYGFARRLDVHV